MLDQATRACGVVVMVGLPAADLKLPLVHAGIREVDIIGVFRFLNWYVALNVLNYNMQWN